MRSITLCLVLLALGGLCNHLLAQDYKVAVGIRFSTADPTISNAVSIKYFMDETNALEGLVSFGNRFGLGGLYERHQHRRRRRQPVRPIKPAIRPQLHPSY